MRDAIAHALLLTAKIVNIIIQQNRSVLQKKIIRKRQSLEKNIEPQVKFK